VHDEAPNPEPEVAEAGVVETPAAEAAAEPVQQDLDALQAKARERDEFLQLAQRTQADFENFRKRAAREQGLAEHRGVVRVVKELLPALDNLERALAAAEGSGGRDPGQTEHHLAEGFRLVQAEIVAALGRVGVEGFAPKGEPFDPNVHEAITQMPVDGAESGTVAEVYQSGYRMADTVIRPARVVVAQ
jgi:molecular chaperone GrpE